MKKIITHVAGVLAAVLIFASSSEATGNRHPDAEADARAHADAAAEASAHAGADATATGGTSSATGGNAELNITNQAQGDYEVRFDQNPNVRPPSIQPTVNCYKTGGAGASGGGVGLSFGGGKIDPYCVEREEIRIAHEIGMTFQAAWRWCNLENNLRIFGTPEDCLQANTSPLSRSYEMLLQDRQRLTERLEETERVLLQRCELAEETGERLEEALMDCLEK